MLYSLIAITVLLKEPHMLGRERVQVVAANTDCEINIVLTAWIFFCKEGK